MSVNEVKVQKAPIAFQVRGTGPIGCRTFAIGDEDHTLGNSVRHILSQTASVEFAGYAVPHPSEPIVHIRVQTVDKEHHSAVDALKEACVTLQEQCAHVLEQLEEVLPETKTDRIQMEKYLMDEGFEEEGNAEE